MICSFVRSCIIAYKTIHHKRNTKIKMTVFASVGEVFSSCKIKIKKKLKLRNCLFDAKKNSEKYFPPNFSKFQDSGCSDPSDL